MNEDFMLDDKIVKVEDDIDACRQKESKIKVEVDR